jgi:hypothetical protein
MALPVLVALSCNAPTPEERATDARIQASALALLAPASTYEAVLPESSLVLQDDSKEALESIAGRIRTFAGGADFDVRFLLRKLLRRNKYPSRLTINSSKDSGWIVDYEGNYTPFLQGNEGDWKRMYTLYPKLSAIKQVSLPAYDKNHDIVLLYICRRTFPSSGSGEIHVYRHTGAILQELGKIQTWTP